MSESEQISEWWCMNCCVWALRVFTRPRALNLLFQAIVDSTNSRVWQKNCTAANTLPVRRPFAYLLTDGETDVLCLYYCTTYQPSFKCWEKQKKNNQKKFISIKVIYEKQHSWRVSSSASDYVKCNKSHTRAVCVSRQQMFACAKSLFISDQDKRKHFCLLLRLFLNNRQEVGSFQSRMIKVISKPSQKRQSMKNADRGFIPLLIQQIRDFHLFLNWG